TDLAKDAYLELIRSDDGGARYQAAHRAAELLFRSQAYGQAAELIASIDRRYAKDLETRDELELMTLKAKVARAQGREKEGAALLEKIVTRDGTRGDALLELARYHRDQGNDQKALLLLERASNLEAYEYDALVEQAQFRVASKQYDEAANLLRQALRIRSEPRVERFLARVEQATRR
ncbi:MAG TPA: hypothetical protein VKA74_17790, partial [Myxococcota bacterium]|nr:hypothetical protein [Myxococcota bacterium]